MTAISGFTHEVRQGAGHNSETEGHPEKTTSLVALELVSSALL